MIFFHKTMKKLAKLVLSWLKINFIKSIGSIFYFRKNKSKTKNNKRKNMRNKYCINFYTKNKLFQKFLNKYLMSFVEIFKILNLS
jgi:hypothetical protein